MKTAYCILGLSHCGVIKFTDELLARIEELKKVVAESATKLKEDASWREHVDVMIFYGGMKWVEGDDGVSRIVPSAAGPVLAYAHHNYPDKRFVDESVRILVGSDDACVESDHEEGSENPFGWTARGSDGYTRDHTLGSIPDVFFSESFLRAWCEHLGKHHLRMHREVGLVVEDMPPDHKALLDKATADFLEENRKDLDEDKEMEQSILRRSCDELINKAAAGVPEGEKFRIGLDFHGVIDDDKRYFSNLSKRILNGGGEVHILTGSQDTPLLRAELGRLGIVYSHLFSISSHHIAAGTHVWEDERGPWMDAEVWNRSKAVYCQACGINIHIDDSEVYGKHFDPDTVYVKYPEMTTNKEKS